MAGRENFSKRAAEVFGALDNYTPSRCQEPNANGTSKQQKMSRSEEQLLEGTVRASHASAAEHPSQEETRLKEKRLCSEVSSKSKRQKLWDCDSQYRHGRSQHRRPGRTPDFVRNPGKWTKYSLADDGTKELKGLTADQVNKHVAFQFLDELKKRKHSEQSSSGSDSLQISQSKPSEVQSQKVVFKKPIVARDLKEGGNECDGMPESARSKSKQVVFGEGGGAGAGVIRMSEYTVGTKTKQKKKLPHRGIITDEGKGEHSDDDKDASTAKRSITLSHLHFDDGDEDI